MVRLARVCRPPAVRRGEPGSGGPRGSGSRRAGSWHPAAEPRRHPSRHGPGHLATAWAVGADLRAVVTYDARMPVVAAAVGLPVSGPRWSSGRTIGLTLPPVVPGCTAGPCAALRSV